MNLPKEKLSYMPKNVNINLTQKTRNELKNKQLLSTTIKKGLTIRPYYQSP